MRLLASQEGLGSMKFVGYNVQQAKK